MTSFAYKTDEASAFANVVYTVPGTVLGGQLKFSSFVGHNWLSLDLKANALAVLDLDQFASGRNESIIAGGTALWALQRTYALASIVGFRGETRLVDNVDDCGPCTVNRYKFDTSGYIGTTTAGHVFDLAGPSGPKLDVRGSVAYTQSIADPFININKGGGGFEQKYTFSTWTGTGAVTLFSNQTLQNGALLRPYIQAYVRQEWDYHNELKVKNPDGTFGGVFGVDQDHTYGGLDAGLTYALGNLTVGAAMYSELSGDERTLGGRLGASWKLNGEGTQRPSAQASPTTLVTWTGLYLGANAGFASADVDMTNLGPDINFAPVGGSDSFSPRGTIGGGQIGYNWQLGAIVVGLEGMWSASSLKEEISSTFFLNETWIADVSQLYSITGRLGVASGRWMPYIRGGFAGAKVTTSMTAQGIVAPFISQSKNWHSGWTIGGGVEYMFAQNWTVGIEYDHYNFESKDVTAVRTNDLVVDNWTVNPDNVQTIAARLNFKLN